MNEIVSNEPVERKAPDPALIQELFDRDPLKLSTQDLDAIVSFFRAERMNYMQPPEPKKAKAAKAKATPEEAAKAVDLLSDLGL